MTRLHKTLDWWFNLGDWYLESWDIPNNAGDMKFRTNMRVIWFVMWSCVMFLTADYWELIPLAMAIWGFMAWNKPLFK